MKSKADPYELLRAAWRANPRLYAREVLGVELWDKQNEILDNLVNYKKVFVKASNAVGKTFTAAVVTNWFFDCFPNSICITTAPTKLQVDDVLWKEVRILRKGRPGLMPKASRMENGDEWFAMGMTAIDDNSFKGRHAKSVLIIFDECVGIHPDIWRAAKAMMTNANADVYWLCICNPTDTSSQAYTECQKGSEYEPARGRFKVMTISAMEHPNVLAKLRGEEPPYPQAVGYEFIDTSIEDLCTPIEAEDATAGDVEWNGEWYRPGPDFEGSVLGRWPSSTSDGVWSDVAFRQATKKRDDFEFQFENEELVLGADLAAGGRDYTTIVARRGRKVIHYETHNGWSAGEIAARMKEVAHDLVKPWEDARDIRLQIDHDAVGYSILHDHAADYNFITVSGAQRSDLPDRYPNVRSQLWFATAELAMKGEVDLSGLPSDVLGELERQLKAPKWSLDASGRRTVEKKLKTKKLLRRSPDDADAINILFYNPGTMSLRLGGNGGIIPSSRAPHAQPGDRSARRMKRATNSNRPSFLRK
jgi:hypothetical protein